MKNNTLILKGLKNYATEEVAALVRPVYNQMAPDVVSEFFDTLNDVARHGADCGFPGFVYYSETVAFFRHHRPAIMAAVHELADGIGEDAVTMVHNFDCLCGNFSYTEVARAMYGRYNDDLTQIYNALAWFALEEVAHAAADYIYENE